MSSTHLHAGSAHVVSCTTTARALWLKLQSILYKDTKGNTRNCARTTAAERRGEAVDEEGPDTKAHSGADAVAVVALLTSHTENPKLLFVKQFRPPVNAYTIEFPAGLIDPGETPLQAALRELKEETGYIGEPLEGSRIGNDVVHVSPELCLSPGMTAESIHVVTLKVDLDDEKNHHPKQDLDEEEDIEILRIEVPSLLRELDALAGENYRIFDGVYLFAYGLVFSGLADALHSEHTEAKGG
ncbi:unnamed protein product [Vitrella brassicaformis CCMP3155]|uniref:Nudix hydrolase domain-containing protein n=1 Tax=Vitrella brassicaformis (strain CCMP3155) TaxID=1169540 RepID=A0A0G4G499_VITBC|nr:unnamed protein product [Vitrella brassicaformis CCMP3155]|eukprot:CEM22964.1 unnamed protein product [Vitrella brassicaformis CCMP3155]